ncbi:uncharacterized protein LOC131663687 [Phymastichus coffea]|uniref:uncharacterized protein LOC131663687 n=1 Tax=Phymastichus coffea TaxID=108790 RepID=UPI00273AA371|nr:uncharacterized protein LOC131663687 [Phymastichus coffea]
MKPVRSADGKIVARALEELIIFRWETPDYLLTDNGKEYVNKHLDSMLQEYGIKHNTTVPYHPQANPVERSNRSTLKPENWTERLKKLKYLHEIVKRNLEKTHEKMADHINIGRKLTEYKTGDLVLIKTHHLSNAANKFSTKLGEKYEGPFKLLDKLLNTVFTIETLTKKKVGKVHIEQLKKFKSPDKNNYDLRSNKDQTKEKEDR